MALFRKSAAAALLLAYLLNGAIHPFYANIASPFDVVLSLFALQFSFLLAVLVPALLIFRPGQLLTVFRLRKLKRTACARIATMALIAFPFILLSAIVSNELADKLGISFDDKMGEFLRIQEGLGIGILVFAGIFAAPIVEEIAFRLSLFDFFRRFFRGSRNVLPIIFTALVFSVLHGDPVRMPGLFLLGVLLQHSLLKYKSILAPVLFHAIHNILSFAAFFIFS
jgi:membrane protease YdiL (CAAX protease family)